MVSTHSRLKAAGGTEHLCNEKICRFNTQPPEGGWVGRFAVKHEFFVSTHSRLKAAGHSTSANRPLGVFQHTAA